ncbi:MAG: pyridoxal-phosphate dependent enzyme [Lysobacterales bacterium]
MSRTRGCASTPLLELGQDAFFKLEFLHIGRSHKARAAVGMLDRAEAAGDLIRNTGQIILEKTGGNLGVSLAIEGRRRGYEVHLVVDLAFSQRKKDLLTQLGAELVGIERLKQGETNRGVVEALLKESAREGKHYVFLDQFADAGSVRGHLTTLVPETAEQLRELTITPETHIDLVLGAGTGASASALKQGLVSAGYGVSLHVVQPEGCSFTDGRFPQHSIQGTAVGDGPRLLDLKEVESYIDVSSIEAERGRQVLLNNFGLLCGISSGANYAAVSKYCHVRNSRKRRVVLSLLYDRGEDY